MAMTKMCLDRHVKLSKEENKKLNDLEFQLGIYIRKVFLNNDTALVQVYLNFDGKDRYSLYLVISDYTFPDARLAVVNLIHKKIPLMFRCLTTDVLECTDSDNIKRLIALMKMEQN